MRGAPSARSTIMLDFRDYLSLNWQQAASHESSDRPMPDDLYAAMTLDRGQGRSDQPSGLIMLFDDLLATGAHYVAATRHLSEAFLGVQVVGSLVARRVKPNPFSDFEDFDGV